MNVDPSEAKDEPEEAPEEEDEKKSDSQSPEKPKGTHTKPRRRKRGSKRKQRENDSLEKRALKAQNPGTSAAAEEKGDSSSPWGPDGELDYDGFILRPVNYPKAPENSTQFIIDDHNESHMYMSFERDSFCYNDPRWGDIREAEMEDEAFIDVDYEYVPRESPGSFFNSKEFEEEYEKVRSERVIKLGRRKIIDQIDKLEEKLRDINDTIVKENPNPVLEELHVELVSLQERNTELKSEHKRLISIAEERGLDIPSTSAFSSESSSDFSPGKERMSSGDYGEETGGSDTFPEQDDSESSSSPNEDFCTLPEQWELPSNSEQPEWDDTLSPARGYSPDRQEDNEAEQLRAETSELFSGPSPDGCFTPCHNPDVQELKSETSELFSGPSPDGNFTLHHNPDVVELKSETSELFSGPSPDGNFTPHHNPDNEDMKSETSEQFSGPSLDGNFTPSHNPDVEDMKSETSEPVSGPSLDGNFTPSHNPDVEDMKSETSEPFSGPSLEGNFTPRHDLDVEDIKHERNSPCYEMESMDSQAQKNAEPGVEDSPRYVRTPSRVFNEDDMDTENCHAFIKRSPCASLKSPERPLLDSSNSIANESPVRNELICQENVTDEHITA